MPELRTFNELLYDGAQGRRQKEFNVMFGQHIFTIMYLIQCQIDCIILTL